jgi:UDP-glucose 4-epimerase
VQSENERVTWVVGGSGLLGGALLRELERQGERVLVTRVPWSDPDAAVDTLLDAARTLPAGGWRLAWCAGAGVVGSDPERLEAEVATVARFLERWVPYPGGTRARSVFVASSAGGVYADSTGPPFTEETVPRPRAPYGHAKLRIEELFSGHAERYGLGLLIGRIANLYGPGQDTSKAQGLISQLCRAVVSGQHATIFVSLDTLRDYLFVDDAASMVAAALDEVDRVGGIHVKILASGRAQTIGQVMGQVTRLARRRPPVLLGSSPSARFQVVDLRLRSTAWPDLSHLPLTPPSVGVSRCLEQSVQILRKRGKEHV